MSYSFNFTAATKEEAIERAEQEFANVVALQPNHEKDRAAALANIQAVVMLLPDDDTQDIAVAANGWVSWTNDPDKIFGVSSCASASLKPKQG